MPARIPEELKKLIDDVIRQDEKSTSEISQMFHVSIPYIKKRKQALGISRPKPAAAESSDQLDTEDTKDTEAGYTLETPAHGKGKLVRGAHPNGGRKKGSKASPVSLQDIASFFGEINPATAKNGHAGQTYLEQFLRGCVIHAINGKEAYASMIFSAIEKSGAQIKLTIENALGNDPQPKALADPLFSAMDNERLRFEALRVLEAQYSQPLDAEFKEVQEA